MSARPISCGPLLALALCGLSAGACQRTAAGGPVPPAHGGPAIPTRVEVREVEDRPPITLVARLGDPQPAAAVAVAHDSGSAASLALGALLLHRLDAEGFAEVALHVHGLGLTAAALLPRTGRARSFVEAVAHALSTPVAPGPELDAILARVRLHAAPTWTGSGEGAAAACSAELGFLPGATESASPSADSVERWRKLAYSSQSVAFAALGPAEVLDAATDGLRATPPWPDTAAPADAWPAEDVVAVDPSPGSQAQLSVALRVPEPAAALRAAELLGAPGGSLDERLEALDTHWRLRRVVGSTRPRGACLRVDLAPDPGAKAPPLKEVAEIAQIALHESRASLRQPEDPSWSLEQSVLRPSDPRRAAAVAAWRALSARQTAGAERQVVAYQTPGGSAAASAALRKELDRAALSWAKSTVELRARVEPGQGELWALVASPCGTAGEPSSAAGEQALLVQTLARQQNATGGVAVEPWITPEGVGLLAHAPPLGPAELPEDHARRVGAALGKLLGSRVATGAALGLARRDLLAQIGDRPNPGWWLALESLAPGHVSWLEPRGSWKSLTEASHSDISATRRHFALGPLRLAVLANWSEEQPQALSQGLEAWLKPARETQQQCARQKRAQPRSGGLRLQTDDPDTPNQAFIGVPLPVGKTAMPSEAEWTLWLLRREGGWLDEALLLPGLVSSAEATLVGGRRASALIVRVTAAPDQLDAAVAQVRGLFERLAKGAAKPDDAALADAHFAPRHQAADLDPRHRIVHLWRGRSRLPPPDLASLRQLHQRAFAPNAHLVVIVKSDPGK